MRCALALAAALVASPAAAQVFAQPDILADMRLQTEQRWLQTQQQALEADLGRLRADQTLNRLERQRQPDVTLLQRQSAQDAAEAEALLRAQQAQSTARAARLRSALGAAGYADSLPLRLR